MKSHASNRSRHRAKIRRWLIEVTAQLSLRLCTPPSRPWFTLKVKGVR